MQTYTKSTNYKSNHDKKNWLFTQITYPEYGLRHNLKWFLTISPSSYVEYLLVCTLRHVKYYHKNLFSIYHNKINRLSTWFYSVYHWSLGPFRDKCSSFKWQNDVIRTSIYRQDPWRSVANAEWPWLWFYTSNLLLSNA